jgi:hypothetical protein
VKKEDLPNLDNKHRIDLWVRTDDGVVSWGDVSVTEPGRKTYLTLGSARRAGVAAKQLESRKRSYWGARAPHGVMVMPLVLETTGYMGESLLSFLELVQKSHPSGPGQWDLITRLSVTVAKWNVECVRQAGRKACEAGAV